MSKLLVNQAYENMGLRTTQLIGTVFDGIARHTPEGVAWRDRRCATASARPSAAATRPSATTASASDMDGCGA